MAAYQTDRYRCLAVLMSSRTEVCLGKRKTCRSELARDKAGTAFNQFEFESIASAAHWIASKLTPTALVTSVSSLSPILYGTPRRLF